MEPVLAIRPLGTATRIHLAISIFLATRICTRQPSCGVGGRIALCSCPRPKPFADGPLVFRRIAFLRILPTLAELISARNHSRNPRTYHRRQPTRQMAASYARGDWVFDDAFVKKSWGWTRCETNLLGTIRAVDDLCLPDFGAPGELS